MDNVISVRLDETQMAILEKLCDSTGWTYSQVFRHLLNNAVIRPAAISVDVPAGKTMPAPKAAAPVVNGR